MIKSLRTFSCRLFAIFFFLWGNGGPNWVREFNLWIDEQNAEWTTVSRRPGRSFVIPKSQSALKSYADIVKSSPSIRTSVFKRLHYPKNYADAFLGNNHKLDPFSSENSRSRQNSNSNALMRSRQSRPLPVWKPISRADFQESPQEISARLDLAKPSYGPLNRCPRCLGLGHDRISCNDRLRCEICFRYGHSQKSYLSKSKSQKFRPVTVKEVEGSRPRDIYSPSSSLTDTSPSNSAFLLPQSIVPEPPSSSPMANFAADPRPFVPKGFVLDDVQASPLLRHEVYVTGCYNKTNEDLAIAKLTPPVHKDDFCLLARELKAFFRDVHQVRYRDLTLPYW